MEDGRWRGRYEGEREVPFYGRSRVCHPGFSAATSELSPGHGRAKVLHFEPLKVLHFEPCVSRNPQEPPRSAYLSRENKIAKNYICVTRVFG